MIYDTLTYSGVEKTFSDWGFSISSIKGSKKNQAAGTFTATKVDTNIVAEENNPTFPFESVIVVQTGRVAGMDERGRPVGSFSGGVVKFVGKRVGKPLKASASGHSVQYTFKDAWYDLEETPYQQGYASGQANTIVLVPETCLFTFAQGFNFNGSEYDYGIVSCGDQLQFILEWLLSQYAAQGMDAPYQLVGSNHAAAPAVTGVYSGGVYTWAAQDNQTISRSLYQFYLPSHITKPLKCEAALRKCLEFSPKTNIWFDYTTSKGGKPCPTIHITSQEDKTPVNLPLFDNGQSHKSISIHKREDLKLRGATITYRLSNSINGKNYYTYAIDQQGLSTGLRTFSDLVDLSGVQETTVSASIDTENLNCWSLFTGGTNGTDADHAAKRAWWGSKRGGEDTKLQDLRVRFQKNDPTKTDGSVLPTFLDDAVITETKVNPDGSQTVITHTAATLMAAGLVNYQGQLSVTRLVEGTVADWMYNMDGAVVDGKPSQGSKVVSLKVQVTVNCQFSTYNTIGSNETDTIGDAQKVTNTAKGQQITANIILTNGFTGSYSAVKSVDGGEAYIIGNGGIAQYLMSQLNATQYDGDAVHVAVDFAAGINLGNLLNLTNGAAEWASMNAQIQSIDEDYGTHSTTVQIGVAKHLNSGQLSALLNMWKFRRQWYNPACRTDSSQGGGGQQQFAKSTGQSNTTAGVESLGRTQHIDYTGAGGTPPSDDLLTAGKPTGVVNNDPTKVTQIVNGKTPVTTPQDMITMQPRELAVCDNAGSYYKLVAHATGGHKDTP